MAENIKTRKYYRMHNGTDWDRMHFVTDANSVDANDGDTMETKVGAIKGITTSTAVTEEGYAADAKTVSELSSSLGNLEFNVSEGKPQWREAGADTWNFFRGDMTVGINAVAGQKTGSGFYLPVEGYTKLTVYLNTAPSSGGFAPAYDTFVIANGKASGNTLKTLTSNGYATFDCSNLLASCTTGYIYFYPMITSSNYGRVLGTVTLSN